VSEAVPKTEWPKSLILAPPSAQGTPWMRRFGPVSSGFASGWMRIRGPRRRRAVDRGFVLSDHVDWPSLLATIEATGAETVWLTHGYSDVVAHWLRSLGKDAHVVATRFTGEAEAEADAVAGEEAAS
jgi:putative mRNA 3-end processing factor